MAEAGITPATGVAGLGSRLRWFGSAFLLATSIWTGAAGGFGLYARQVGATRAWTAVAVAFAAIESGKFFAPHRRHGAHGHPGKAQAKAVQLKAAEAKPAGL